MIRDSEKEEIQLSVTDKTSKKEKLIAIDGTSLIYRFFYAIQNEMRNKEGQSTRGIYGFLSMVFKLIEDYKPDYFVVAWDLKGPTFRHKQYEGYKANRKPMPDDLASEMPILQSVLEAIDIKNMSLAGYEADDILGTISKRAESKDMDVLIVTGDRDALQLASDNVNVMINKKGITNFDMYDRNTMIKEYGMTPEQFIDLKALMGDSSDNIKGVPGVGKVTGQKLIQEYGSIENLKNKIDEISKPKLKQSLLDYKDILEDNKTLVTIVRDVPIEFDFEDLRFDKIDKEKTKEWFVKLEFKRFQKLLDLDVVELNTEKEDSESILPIDIKLVKRADDIIEFLEDIGNLKDVYIKTITDNNHINPPSIEGFSLAYLKNEDFSKLSQGFLLEDMDEIVKVVNYLSEKEISLVGHNLKEDIFPFVSMGINELNLKYDTQVAEYVKNPSKRDYNIETLSLEYISVDKLTQVYQSSDSDSKSKKNIGVRNLSPEKTLEWLGHYFVAVTTIKKLQEEYLKTENLWSVFEDIEMPLITVLARMESRGVKIDIDILNKLRSEFSLQIEELENDIFEEAGEKFNINSPAQLGVILFEKLKLPYAKKTKRGYSTSAAVLDKLKGNFEIVDFVLEYRALTKLMSTYIDGMLKLVGNDGRIRPHFMQTVTATGRLSCTEPNLQNIPIKTEQGRRIRKAFISSSEDRILVGADYSQIELRVLAHLSGDKALIDAFNNGEDIHKLTAMKVFGINSEDVTPLLRSRAKAINFGVIYGMSGFGLSENLDISMKDADNYIKDYFKKYESVKKYMDDEIKRVKSSGFSTTIFGRKRYIGDINATNFMVRKAAERLAMNSPIQGSAADIIKIAMNNVQNRIESESSDIALILQIHDELILEGPVEKKDLMVKILKEEMEGAASLSVKMASNVDEGRSWYDLK